MVECIYGEDVKRIDDIVKVQFNCGKCNCTSPISKKYILSDESVETDRLNDVFIGNAFIACPVCGKKEFFWSK